MDWRDNQGRTNDLNIPLGDSPYTVMMWIKPDWNIEYIGNKLDKDC